ncbi:MAG: dTDP-4-dehydrorhamnose reductase [Bacteroidota bacterium]
MKHTIVVTGANGQLGKCLQDIAPLYPGIKFIFLGRDELPIQEFDITKNVLETIRPSIVINAAAYTAVDKAETEISLALLINGYAVGNLAAVCNNIGAKFLHVSTDYVFDGNAIEPYSETDLVSPVNLYGASKLKGEELAVAANENTVVVRTSWVYSRHGNNFVKTMLRLMKERESIGVVDDQRGCPTYAIDLAEAIIALALQENTAGIYHFSNSGPISWHQFAKTINDNISSNCIVNPIPTSAYPTPAKRPVYSALNNEKIISVTGIKQYDWEERLAVCLDLLT